MLCQAFVFGTQGTAEVVYPLLQDFSLISECPKKLNALFFFLRETFNSVLRKKERREGTAGRYVQPPKSYTAKRKSQQGGGSKTIFPIFPCKKLDLVGRRANP